LTFIQQLTTKPDVNGNSRKLTVLYGEEGNVTKCYVHSVENIPQPEGSHAYLLEHNIPVSEYNTMKKQLAGWGMLEYLS